MSTYSCDLQDNIIGGDWVKGIGNLCYFLELYVSAIISVKTLIKINEQIKISKKYNLSFWDNFNILGISFQSFFCA